MERAEMNKRVLCNSGIQPEIVAKFKEIFPEHADIEEYLHTHASRNDSGHRHDSTSIANTNNNASLEQAQFNEALILSILQAQTFPFPSNNPPVSTTQISRLRNLTPHGSEMQAATPDNVNPDNMTYEELQSLGDAIGTESKGLSIELIASFPTQKLDDKSGWFSSKKTKPECAICLMEYRTGDELLTLPCLHLYHNPCITQWLADNKTCPVCNMDLSSESSQP